MEELYSSFSLKLLNLFIGLCRGAAGLPDHLRVLGYQDRGIEFRFQNAQNESVCPELILASIPTRHTILCEWKSGPNLDPKQLGRYCRVTADDLRERAFLPAPAVEAHDATVVGAEEHAERLLLGIDKASCDLPLLLVTAGAITLRRGHFARQQVTDVFRPGMKVDMTTSPMAFVPFDRESPDWVIAHHCFGQIVSYMAGGESEVLLGRLVADVCPVWSKIGGRSRSELEERIKRVVIEAARNELDAYLRRNRGLEGRTHTPTWDITNNPLHLATDKRTTEWRRVKRKVQQFVESLRSGNRQLNLGVQGNG